MVHARNVEGRSSTPDISRDVVALYTVVKVLDVARVPPSADEKYLVTEVDQGWKTPWNARPGLLNGHDWLRSAFDSCIVEELGRSGVLLEAEEAILDLHCVHVHKVEIGVREAGRFPTVSIKLKDGRGVLLNRPAGEVEDRFVDGQGKDCFDSAHEHVVGELVKPLQFNLLNRIQVRQQVGSNPVTRPHLVAVCF